MADPASHQASQAGLAILLSRELDGIASHLAINDPGNWLSQLIAYVVGLTNRYGSASAALAVQQYRATRVDAGVRGSFTVRPAAPPPLEQVAATVGWATTPLRPAPPKPLPGIQPDVAPIYTPTVEPDLAAAERNLVAGVEKLVLDQGRQTIVDNVGRDPKSTGWARVTEPDPCAFCALLATRGAVYKHASFHRSNARFQDGVPWISDFKVHDNCRCHAEPIFGPWEPSAQVREWQALYRDKTTSGNSAKTRREWRHAYDAHTAKKAAAASTQADN